MFLKAFQLRPLAVICSLAVSVLSGMPAFAAPHQVVTESSGDRPLPSLQQLLPASVQPCYYSALNELYRQHLMQAMWQSEDAIRDFQQQLTEVALSGIHPQFTQWLQLLSRPDIKGMAKDVVLSDALLGYLQFVAGVPAQGENWLYGPAGYRLDNPPAMLVSRWQQTVAQGTTREFIDSLMPQHPQYKPMQKAMVKLLADRDPWPQFTLRGSLKPGDSEPAVAELRKNLLRGGWLRNQQMNLSEPPVAIPAQRFKTDPAMSGSEAATSPVVAENIYSAGLVDAVRRFQQWQGLTADGVVGSRTSQWLNTTPQQRASLLALNMQRLRLLPDDRHSGIMVNIANFSLDYYVDQKIVLSSRVIVGRPQRKTPLMRSALNSVVLNPPWNVPYSLIREDLIPRIRREPDYLPKHHYRLYSGWGADAEIVDPASVNWSTVSAKAFPFRVQQAPGPQNALGRYKFNMPSADAIYLHDTPNHELFDQDIRAISSGCVRVNKASVLAGLLLQNVGWDSSRISSALQLGETRAVAILQRVPVNLFYLTAWASEEGQVFYRTDIYNYDHLARKGQSAIQPAEKVLL